jgi:Zn-dependent protease with chaperone function
MFNLVLDPIGPEIRQGVLLPLLVCAGLMSQEAESAPAVWFPDPPAIRHYAWTYQPCPGCEALVPRPEWTRMAALAGLPKVRFIGASDESNGPAYSAAPNVVVLTPSALKLEACQLVFIIGHEIVHIAQRHFDEDAIALSVYSGMPRDWTDQGEDAMQLVDGDFGLALRVSHLWQDQEDEADWMGALLAAQACGCSIESSALAYLRQESDAGGGMAAAHAPSADRIRKLLSFAESARRLIDLAHR